MAVLETTDIKRPTQREQLTELEAPDAIVVEDVTDSKIKWIRKDDLEETLGITDLDGRLDTLEDDESTEGSVSHSIKTAFAGETQISLGPERADVDIEKANASLVFFIYSNGDVLAENNTRLTKYDAGLEVIWQRTDINPRCAKQASDGTLYVGTSAGIHILTSAGVDIDFLEVGDTREIAFDSVGNFYSAQYAGTLVKREPDGTELWSKSITNCCSVAVDSTDSVWVCGYFNGNSLLKYDSAGTELYVASVTSPITLAVDNMNNVICVMNTSMQKRSPANVQLWLTTFGIGAVGYFQKISIVSGFIYSGNSTHARKFDPNGNLVWSTITGASGYRNSAITNGNGYVYCGRSTSGFPGLVRLKEYRPINWRA